MDFDLGFFDQDENRVEPAQNPFLLKVYLCVRYKLLPMSPARTLDLMARPEGLEAPTTWFEVIRTNSTFQLEQSLATLAAFANPT
jgi:hypothetical protein